MKKDHQTFVAIVNGYSIYWKHRDARYDAYTFVMIKKGVQEYRVESLYGAIRYCLHEDRWTSRQRKRFISLAEEYDCMNVFYFKNVKDFKIKNS